MNVKRETKINTADTKNWIVTDYEYDGYGNMTKKSAASGEQTFVTQYEYGIDADGTMTKVLIWFVLHMHPFVTN